jgi:hypothetical protein
MENQGPGGPAQAANDAKPHRHVIHFTVDGEPCETTERELTPNQIIRRFGDGRDPTTNYLVQITPHGKISYQGKGDEPIKLHEGMKFQIISTGPTPVSDGPIRTGVSVFIEGLRELGLAPSTLPNRPDHVVFDYRVESGRFAGKQVRLGFVAPADFPITPPSGPYVSPHIHPIKTDGGHPTGAVHAAQAEPFQAGAGGEWQYWSRPFKEWAQSRQNVAAYMAHIWRLWDSQ